MALQGEEIVMNFHVIGDETEAMQQEQPVFAELLPAENGYVTVNIDENLLSEIYGLIQQEESNGVNTSLEDVGANPIPEEGNGVNLQKLTLDNGTQPIAPSVIANITTDEDLINLHVSPAEVCGEKVKSKRGRKRKYPEGQRPKRQRGGKKPKVYELPPIQDPVMEKKRLSALNAKRHRDMQKKEKEDLQNQLRKITEERDQLKQLVENLKRKESTLEVELESFRTVSIETSELL